MPDFVEISGSHREPLSGARRTADAPPDEKVRISVVVRRRPGAAGHNDEPLSTDPDASRLELRQRLAEQRGADPRDMAKVERFLRDAGLDVLSSDPATRIIAADGTVEQMSTAFGVSLGHYQTDEVAYRGREGAVHVPADIADLVEAVLGLDDRPQARSHVKPGRDLDEGELPDPESDADAAPGPAAAARAPAAKPLWAMQVAKLYGFPENNGAGETIAILELGGGYTDADLAAYFTRAKISPAPTVQAVGVDQGSNQPGGDADGEVLLDIEVAGSIAPGAKIVVYFADNSDRGFLDALTTAAHDTTNAPSVISISWGGPEAAWTTQARKAFDGALADAAALGVTVLAAAGDHGAADGGGDGKVYADFPASSPHIVACGGTTLVASRGKIASEVVWNDNDGWATGGGISSAFKVPAYQQDISMPANLNGSSKPGRGVPDIAGNADSTSGYIVRVDGQWTVVGGTSAVAPLYAGLVAQLNQALGRPVGALLPALYGIPAADRANVFRDITTGNNSVPASQFGPATAGYSAAAGWDACTGLGSVHGAALATRLQSMVQHHAAPA
ncbi:MAG: S53 family peptidase [Solirubrobacteraceae bacterium]